MAIGNSVLLDEHTDQSFVWRWSLSSHYFYVLVPPWMTFSVLFPCPCFFPFKNLIISLVQSPDALSSILLIPGPSQQQPPSFCKVLWRALPIDSSLLGFYSQKMGVDQFPVIALRGCCHYHIMRPTVYTLCVAELRWENSASLHVWSLFGLTAFVFICCRL